MTDYQSRLISEIASIPIVSSGNFMPFNDDFELNLNIRKYSGDLTKKSSYVWRSGKESSLTESNPEIKFRSYSPDGEILLIGKCLDETSRFIEVWLDGGCRYSTSINVSNIHGDFLSDEVFSSFSWSPNIDKFIYVSEKKQLDEPKGFSKFIEKENFGERLQIVKEPILCLFDLKTMKIETIEPDINSIYVSQPVFITNDSIAFMGIKVGSKKLGMTYIYCRPSVICTMNLTIRITEIISNPNLSSRSPIVSRDCKTVAYLRNSLGLSHFKASQLILYNLESKTEKVIVDILRVPKNNEFTGIYCQRLPNQRFSDFIHFNTCLFDLRTIMKVDLITGQVDNIFPEFSESLRILDIKCDNSLLVCGSTTTCPGTIFIVSNTSILRFPISPIENNPIHHQLSQELESSVIELNPHVHVVLLKRKTEDKLPLIIVPHGGPNSVYSVDYVFYPLVLAKLGYAVASINYTGSIGFGDSSIEALEGQIGVRDVEDCHLALQLLLNLDKFDPKRVIVMGGSHGGYLTAFLSAKYPDLFIGAILRNPVIDLPSMMVTSDISDWTFGQLGLNYDQIKTRGIRDDELKLFQDRSPSKYADNVKCKTLVMLGALDLRVPPSQGKYWASLLKSNGIDCQILWFPDSNHGLETADSERFGLEAILSFLNNL